MVGRKIVRAMLAVAAASAFRTPVRALRSPLRTAVAPLRADANKILVVRGEDAPPPLEAARPPTEVLDLQRDLVAVRDLPRNTSCTQSLFGPTQDLSDVVTPNKPTFRRLFSHGTWEMHLGGGTLARWSRCIRDTRKSVILRSIGPTVLLLMAYTVALLKILPPSMLTFGQNSQLPLSFCGSAIGLLLVFRTNDAYARLGEARANWGRIVHYAQNIASRAAASNRHGGLSSKGMIAICRYLCAYAWSLRDLLRDGDERDNVLKILVEDAREADWVASSPNRPAALLHRLRDTITAEMVAGKIDDTNQLLFENDLSNLAYATADCLRIFTSPIPPTMSRHGIRSLTLWLLALPVVLAGTVPAGVNVAWSAITAFIYLGIDELGVQVEQPFAIMPLWQLCQSCQDAVLGALDAPQSPLYHPRDSYVFS